MDTEKKQVRYTATNTYLTLNKFTSSTRNVWMVFHGIGFLSSNFIPYFNELNPEENYIIAPQAPSKYYLSNAYKRIGASWLTREDTAQEIANVLNFLNAVYKAVAIPNRCQLLVLGFSQGVSIATRWVALSKILCDQLVLFAGRIPEELRRQDFEFLEDHAKVTFFVGDSDEFLSPEQVDAESEKIKTLFKGSARLHIFEGGHEIKKELLTGLI